MTNRPKRLYLTVGILIPIVLFWGLYETPGEQTATQIVNQNNRASSYFKTLSAKRFDEDGRLINTLASEHVDVFEHQNLNIFTYPVLQSYGNAGSITTLTANKGELRQGSDQLMLAGDVDVQDNAQPTGFKLNTQWLSINLEEQTAYTSEPVTLTAKNTVYNSTGMHAWLEESKIELLSNVQGIHEVTP